MIDSAKLVK